MAYGVLHLKPWEFASLTPGEFHQMAQGADERHEQQRWRDAWVVSHLMNISGKHVKREISPAELMGPKYVKRQIQERKKKRGQQ